MGLRAASVRHPNAVVMAPALTEAGQSKNFTLPPSSPINSVTNKNDDFISNSDENSQMCKTDIKRAYVTNVTKYLTDSATETATTKRTTTEATTLIKQKLPIIASDIQNHHHLNNTIIMSTCPTSMGDQQDNMGLQKTGMDAMTSLLKDKSMPNDVEQLLNNLSTDITTTGDLTQNVDDLMRAWNNANVEREQGDAETETETETIFPIAFERELFGDVDMMNMCGGDDDHLGQSQTAAKELRAKEMLDELHKKQVKLERRTEFILRRIRKLQIRHMGYHCSSEVAGLYEYVHRTLRRVKDNPSPTMTAAGSANETGLEVPTTIQTAAAVEPALPITSASVNSLVRRLHLSSMQQSNTLHRQKHIAKYFGSGSSEQLVPVVVRHPVPGTIVVPRFTHEARDEIERVAGTLQTELIAVESQVDSDATASSSGAESCDEMNTHTNQHQNFLSINKRAAWRYANERAQVASRWTWLQAQISDLEYRIRQYNDLHRQIRSSKGAVQLADVQHHPHQQQRTSNSIATPTTTTIPMSPNAVNGYRGQLPGATSSKIVDDVANGAVSGGGGAGCSRTRPLHRASFRKRKLLQTTGLHTVSKKASRPSNIRCGCVPPTTPCALCTGRTDPTFPRDCAEQLTVPERIALLDPGFHPVLSFPDDISQSIHLEAIMKLPDWQQKSLRCNLKSLKGMVKSDRSDKALMGAERPKKSEHRKKYNNRLIKSELKNKMGRGRRSFRGVSGFRIKKRHTAKMAMAQLNALTSESMDELEMESLSPGIATKGGGGGGGGGGSSSGGGAGGDSLNPSPLSHVQVVPYRRNRSVDSYDIDNIVIPYSVAAATRVEKLQYKEILTPKWRVIDCDFPAKYDTKNNGIVRRVSEDSDVEDVTEETISSRHDKCEHEEKKKFLSYIKFPLTGAGRSRANRRTDSRAESSGANTPDPMSPHNNNNNININNAGDNATETAINSPITSPPATPLSMLNNSEDSSISIPQQQQQQQQQQHQQQQQQQNLNALRRRTVSQSRWAAHNREESRCITPDNVEAIPPYEPRAFPLAEELYDKMLKSMPEGHSFPGLLAKQSSRDSDVTDTQFPDSRPVTPVSDSTESAIAEEDPNDPEWIDVERVRDRAKR